MANIQQIVKELRKSLSNFDLEKAIQSSDNEAKTRMYLVEPFFEMLRFNRGFENGNLVAEYDADFAKLKGKKVDYAILLKSKPEVLIEVKKSSIKLTNKNTSQLNEYFNNTSDSKIGILTNGVVYQFFCRNLNGSTGLHPTPFYTFNWENIDGSQLEKLAEFYYSSIDIKAIMDSAQESFFMEGFEEALYKEVSNPSKDFIRAIFNHMHGTRLTTNIEVQIKDLLNSVSLKYALDRLIVEESSRVNSGIITTDDELKAFHIIKTMLVQHKQIDSSSISYKDYKGKFSIILFENIKYKICDLYITPASQKIEIDGEKLEIGDFDSLIKLKKKLIDKALDIINSQ